MVYSGDNDLVRAGKKNPESVAKDFETLVARIRASVPSAPIFLLSIKPSPARHERWPAMAKANSLMQAICETSDTLEYIDVASHLFTGDGALRPEAFASDGIHLSDLGYREWAKRIAPRLAARLE